VRPEGHSAPAFPWEFPVRPRDCGALHSAVVVALHSAFALVTPRPLGAFSAVAQELSDDVARGVSDGDAGGRRGSGRWWAA